MRKAQLMGWAFFVPSASILSDGLKLVGRLFLTFISFAESKLRDSEGPEGLDRFFLPERLPGQY
jgi:hypothetical protein